MRTCLSSLDGSQVNKNWANPIQVPLGLVTRARAKRFKDGLNGLIQFIWAENNSTSPEAKLQLIHLVQAIGPSPIPD